MTTSLPEGIIKLMLYLRLQLLLTYYRFLGTKMLGVGEEMTLCPYNRFHVVKKLRIQKHILKCKEKYPEIKLVTCVYNYSHRLKPEDLLEHYETCPHKIRLDDARYYEPDGFGRFSYAKSDRQSICFPDINFKPSVSLESKFHSEMEDLDSQHQHSSSDFEMPPLKSSSAPQFSADTYDSDNDSDLEPLPLPKTVSKAFVCVKEPEKSDSSLETSVETSKPKGFGRGRKFVNSDTLERIRSPWFSLRNDDSICGQSLRSSMFDDAATLQSVDISIDEDIIDDVLKDLDKYVKI